MASRAFATLFSMADERQHMEKYRLMLGRHPRSYAKPPVVATGRA